MRKLNFILTLMLLFIGVSYASADGAKQTLPLGNYADVAAGDMDESQCYNSSYYMVSPTTFYQKNTGNQIIYTKEQLADMAGKDISGISFLLCNISAFQAYPRKVCVWMQEIDDNAFAYDAEAKKYSFFEYDGATQVLADYNFDVDFVEYCYLNYEMALPFSQPFTYSGEKNLLVTVSFEGDETTDGSTDVMFYYNTDEVAAKKVMGFGSDKATFSTYHESEDWPFAISDCFKPTDGVKQPLTQFTYQESSKPVVKPATLTGTVTCGEAFIEGATVALSDKADTICYSATTDAEGKYTITIDSIDKKYALSVKATDYVDFAGTDSLSFASDETKTLDVALVKADKPSVLSGKIVSTNKSRLIKDAVVTLKNAEHEYTATSDENGEYTMSVVKSEEKYKLSVAAADHQDYTSVDSVSFTPGEPKTLNITLTYIDKPSVLSGVVSSNGTAVKGAEVSLKSKNSTYTYKATTDEEGKYSIKVVKSEEKYKLTATEGDYNDYAEADSIAFVPGEDMTKDIELTPLPTPDSTVTLGSYNRFMKQGDADDCYYGHGYSWAAAPTHFYLKHTGSQIIYTKEQLAEMAGKAIKQVNFIYYNEGAYSSYPRTVKVYVQEISDNAFEYDTNSSKYKFFEYNTASTAVASYNFAGDLYETAGMSAEMELAFDKPLNYSGEKNLLLTITFDGDETCNSLDMSFFCQADVKNKAMSYMNDYYTFDEYADTEDWPFITDDCIPSLEQPVTRFFYTEAVVDGINSLAADKQKNAASDKLYNLSGQRVGNSFKGIVVSNGKKYVK